MRKGAVGLLMALAMAGCSMLAWSSAGGGGRFLFDSFVLDNTWGYSLAGFYIDADGGVWRYQRNEPWYPAELRSGVVREDDLLKKYQNAVRVGKVDADTLATMRDRIPAAARGRVSGEPLAFERSGKLDVAYVYDSRLQRYSQVFLGGGGDWVARNDAPEARELLEWLRVVEQDVGFDQ